MLELRREYTAYFAQLAALCPVPRCLHRATEYIGAHISHWSPIANAVTAQMFVIGRFPQILVCLCPLIRELWCLKYYKHRVALQSSSRSQGLWEVPGSTSHFCEVSPQLRGAPGLSLDAQVGGLQLQEMPGSSSDAQVSGLAFQGAPGSSSDIQVGVLQLGKRTPQHNKKLTFRTFF